MGSIESSGTLLSSASNLVCNADFDAAKNLTSDSGDVSSQQVTSPLEWLNVGSDLSVLESTTQAACGKIWLLEINGYRYGGIASRNANECQVAQEIHQLMQPYVLTGVFPPMSEEHWADNYHFNKSGFVIFCANLALNFKKHLESIDYFRADMRLFVVSDSTLDFLNFSDGTWFGCGDWVGYGKVIFEEAFLAIGIKVILDTACGTGFALGSWAGVRFGERMKKHRESLKAQNQWRAYDGVLLIGGYNDVISKNKKKMSITIPEAVAETLQECKRFVHVKQHSFDVCDNDGCSDKEYIDFQVNCKWNILQCPVQPKTCNIDFRSKSCSTCDSSSIQKRKMPPFPLKGNNKLKKKWKTVAIANTQKVLRGGMRKLSEASSSTTFSIISLGVTVPAEIESCLNGNFTRCATEGDGACGLHALFGEYIGSPGSKRFYKNNARLYLHSILQNVSSEEILHIATEHTPTSSVLSSLWIDLIKPFLPFHMSSGTVESRSLWRCIPEASRRLLIQQKDEEEEQKARLESDMSELAIALRNVCLPQNEVWLICLYNFQWFGYPSEHGERAPIR